MKDLAGIAWHLLKVLAMMAFLVLANYVVLRGLASLF